MRRVTTCAPIISEKYATGWKDGVPETLAGLSNTSVRYYEFGARNSEFGKGDNGCDGTNSTTNLTTFCVTKYQKDNVQAAYTVQANSAYYNNKLASDFEPISDFQIHNGDTTLISIFSKARYAGSTTDPLFKALNQSSPSSQFYTASNDLGVLGCVEQYQFCNLGNERCTDLTGLYGVKQAIEKGDISLTAKQQAVYQVLWKSAWSMGLQWAFKVLSDDLLRAQDWVFTVKSTTSSSLPSNQWEIESFNLHNLSLAVFQRRIYEYSSPENIEIRPGLNSLNQTVRPTDANMLELCGLQKIRSNERYSVSVMGMGIILGIGSILILLDWIIIQQIFWFRSFTNGRHTKKSDWTNTGTLQLQRQALETRGIGPWSTKIYDFPVLVERFRTFVGPGTPANMVIPLDQIHGQWTYGLQGTAYQGGAYAAVPHQRSNSDVEIHVEDHKAKESRHR
ncbi:hypothetical protein K505DRAFT_244347 [Melanomma pulvis-pyrius CBS 109.77]|uniref:Uncharacterized protein n=1 Tax=Melanomma pulvis-pyrius CBS 109.77 TaxID=1314802 RepID=A0A6A6XCM7_9PLEO|nr:hypothetical protein K505DRAFT_244347 [Melanomma pulvis-pyrius CBS 109.77]